MSNGTAKVIGEVIAGKVAGLVLGVLFAPDKSSKTRRRLAGSTKELVYDLKCKLRGHANGSSNKVENMWSWLCFKSFYPNSLRVRKLRKLKI